MLRLVVNTRFFAFVHRLFFLVFFYFFSFPTTFFSHLAPSRPPMRPTPLNTIGCSAHLCTVHTVQTQLPHNTTTSQVVPGYMGALGVSASPLLVETGQ